MSLVDLKNDIKNLDRALDALCQAAVSINETDDWVALSALVTLEGMIDDLGERVTELRGIRDAVQKMKEQSE